MKRIFVTGANGLLGSSLCLVLEAAGHVVFRQGRNSKAQVSCNPQIKSELRSALEKHEVDILINLIGNTDVDQCERDLCAAFDANVRVTESIVSVLEGMSDIHLIHISTDQLYNGPGPHAESDVEPINVYALTKYTGEIVASRIDGTVLRTNFVGRSTISERKSLSDWIVESLNNNSVINVFRDIYFSPLHVSTLCREIERVAVMQCPGVYNLGANGGVSKAEFARELADKLGLDIKMLNNVDSTDMNLNAKRPLDMTMRLSNYEDTFSCKLPLIQNEIELVAHDY
jgi:dTDP-4-dehydrorhamnose reductase